MWTQIEDDDALLAKALEESLRHYNEVELPRTQASKLTNEEPPKTNWQDNKLFAQQSTSKQSNYGQQGTSKQSNYAQQSTSKQSNYAQQSTSKQSNYAQQSTSKQAFVDEDTPSKSCTSPEKQDLYKGGEAEGFDLQAGKTWLYPTNYPVREYQRSIVETALFHNTLVSLPTGLGKTFIAAVVMYNFYKWYPKGKVIFMAPTKPLVAQQVEHCYNTMGIPRKDTAEMTGALPSKDRGTLWRGKRVFFLTPQVVQNDLSSGICPATAVKCVVIDEAHRATGEYAYCQVVKLLQSFGGNFRVLALSATPGSDITAVQKVVNSLMISHIEIRNEDSPDLAAYTHERKIEIMSVSVGPIIIQIREKYLRIMGEYCRKLQTTKVLFGNIASLSSFQILKSWNEFKSNPPPGMHVDTARVLSADFSLLHTLAHGLDLLQNYGLRLLLTNLTDVMEDPTNSNGTRLKRNDELLALLEEIRTILDPPPDTTLAPSQPDFIYGHPKLDALKDVVENHFKDFEARGVETRVIVFCEYREAVIEIRQLLTALQPLVKPVGFMGQSSGKHGKGISQKNQLLVMEQFRKGVFNTLVSTSVGEEGLDIGEVDLIICYDAKNSPIRQVQRMGRTGRKRKGRIIVLVTEGKEEMKFRSALAKKKNINAMLVEKDSLKGYLLDESPSMLPKGFETKCVERKAVIAPTAAPLQQQDLRKMFSRKTTSTANNVTDPVLENAFVSDDELNQMLPEALEEISKAEDYLKNLNLSRYLEWQRYLQFTHEVDHSTSSEIMRDLLSGALDQENNFQDLQTQITATQIWPGLKKRGPKRPATSAGKEKGKRKKPRISSEKKPGRPASSSSSESDNECPIPSSFQAKPPRVNPPVWPINNTVTDEPDDHFPVDKEYPMDQPPSPLEIDDDLEDADLDPEIRAALKKLGIAFRKENDSPLEDDNCPVCSHLDPCPKLQKMINEEKREPNLSWNKLEEMLNRVESIVPRLTAESFTLPTPPTSPVFVSMIPRYEFQPEENDFNSGIICGGVGDVSVSPFKESGIVKDHLDVLNPPEIDHFSDSFFSPEKSKIVKHHSDVPNSPEIDHLGEGTLLDSHLDDILAKIASQTNRNEREVSALPEDLVTSPILGSQLRKPRSSQVTPKVNPKKSLFPLFHSQNRKQSPTVPTLFQPKDQKESPKKSPIQNDSPLQPSSQRNISLDFESFLMSQGSDSVEGKTNSPQNRVNCLSPRTGEEVKVNGNELSPVLSKSQTRSKQSGKEFGSRSPNPEEKSNRSNGHCLSKTGPTSSINEETRKEIEAFFGNSEDDMFAGLDNQFDGTFNLDAQQLDLDNGFMNKPREEIVELSSSPRRNITPPPVQNVDPPVKLADLVWMDKSNAPFVANVAPPQSRKKLSLKKNSSKQTSILGKTKNLFQRKSPDSPKHVPDCFQLKKPSQSITSKPGPIPQPKEPLLDITSRPVSKLQPREPFQSITSKPVLKFQPKECTYKAGEICRSSDDDEFTRRVPDWPLSPIAKLERPVTPNSALDELVKNLLPVSSDSSPEHYRPKSPEKDNRLVGSSPKLQRPKSPKVDNRKRLLSSSPSPEMPRKKKNVQSSPESPFFVRSKKGFRRPLDDTVMDTPGSSGWLQAKNDSRNLENGPSTTKTPRRTHLSESSDEELVGRKARKAEKRKDQYKKNKEEKKKKTKKKSSRFAFLDSQAVESEDDLRNSSDGESTSLDGLDSSFINDSSDETVVDNGVDIQARYLQAVRSPAVKPNAFKIPHRSAMPYQGNVFSQAVDANEYSCYMNDSFCVEEELEQSDPEMSLLEVAEARLKAEKKERRMQKEKKPKQPKKRSRIVRPTDSSESDDDIHIIESKINESKTVDTKPAHQDMNINLVDKWYDDDFYVPEINDLLAAESSSSKPGPSFNRNSTSKSERTPVKGINTDDINQLFDDDFDFSKVSSVENDILNDCAETKPKRNGPLNGPSTSRNDPLVIFVAARQVASATEILRLLRITYKISISCRSSTDADYVISRRLGVCRIAISDLKSNEKMEPIVKRLKEAFAVSVLIVENDKENCLLMAKKTFMNKGTTSLKKTSQPEWTSTAITSIVNLRQASVELLFSDEKALTARLIADLTKRERAAGFNIPPIPQEFTNEMEKKLKFLTTIPGINIALAVHLVEKFKTIKSFISNCSKVKDIQRNVGVNQQTAQKIHNILYQVHMS